MRSNYDDRTPDGTKKGTSTEIGLIAQEVLTVEKANAPIDGAIFSTIAVHVTRER